MAPAVPEEYFATRFRAAQPRPTWPARFLILSAHATTGESWSAERNRDADLELRGELERRDVWFARVVGYDPHSEHAEPSWAVDLTLEEGLELARRYLQLGLFEVLAGEVEIVMCADASTRARLGSWAQRLDP